MILQTGQSLVERDIKVLLNFLQFGLGEHTKDMDAKQLLGNVILLLVGGNDTTRNSISGGLLALNHSRQCPA